MQLFRRLFSRPSLPEATSHTADSIKIQIDLPPDYEVGHERLWASQIDGDTYCVENIPVFAPDLHLHDCVRCRQTKAAPVPLVIERVARSGNRTVRLWFQEHIPVAIIRNVLRPLADSGATWESLGQTRYVITIPREAPYHDLLAMLYQHERNEIVYVYADTEQE
jgi:hypothetical protein